jgi:hypothetical protein
MSYIRNLRTIFLIFILAIANFAWADQSNLFTWFRGGESAEFTTRVISEGTLPAPLAKFIRSRIGKGDPKFHLSEEDFVRCYSDSEPETYWYNLKLINGGIEFVVPFTSNGSCGDSIMMTFKELAPFMNKNGKAAVALIQKSGGSKQ